MLPVTSRNSTATGPTVVSVATLVRTVLASPGGASSGRRRTRTSVVTTSATTTIAPGTKPAISTCPTLSSASTA